MLAKFAALCTFNTKSILSLSANFYRVNSLTGCKLCKKQELSRHHIFPADQRHRQELKGRIISALVYIKFYIKYV